MSVTVVTGLYNIGRVNWIAYVRSWEKYLECFKNMSALEVDMVIFVDPANVELVREYRSVQSHRTIIKPLPFEQLRCYRYLERIKEIQARPQYQAVLRDPVCPEVREPFYNVTVNSKADLVKQVVDENPFQSDLFVWMDAGYGHGNKLWPDGKDWIPQKMIERIPENKVTRILLQSLDNAIDDNWVFFCQHIDIDNGGIYGGSAKAISEYHRLYYQLLEDCLDQNIVDDDQYYSTLLTLRHPELFDLHRGWWYDGYTMFC